MKTLFINMLLLFTATLSFAQVPNYVPTNGLVGWWPFNGNANDESGNGNNLSIFGAVLSNDRLNNLNKSYSFTGQAGNGVTGTYMSIPNIGINTMTEFTISLWVKEQSVLGDGESYICFGDNGSSIEIARNGFNLPSNSGILRYNYGNFQFITVDTVIQNQWVMYTMTRSNNTLKAFINDILIGAIIDTLNSVQISNSGNYLSRHTWGPSSNQTSTRYNGQLDDIGIWNRALTQCEIADLYNAQAGSNATGNTITQSSCNSFTLNNQTYTQSGTYTQNLTNAAGCDSIITLNLTINNSPTASSSSTGATFHGANDGTVNLNVSGGAAPYSFSWSNGANTEDLNAVAAGNYNVTITDANNCTATSTVTVNQPPLALVKSPESIISSALYPNPASAQTRLELQLNQAQDFEIAVYNNLGQRLYNKNYINTKELNENIDMRQWPAGQYFVEIKLAQGTEVKKLIKE